MKKTKNSEYTREDFWHGRKIKRCVIQGKEITDARVSDDIADPESFHICQNVVGLISLDWFGLSAEDNFGYDYTFFMAGADDPLLEEIEFYDEPRNIREVQVGDVVVDEDEKHVLARLGNILALSVLNKPNIVERLVYTYRARMTGLQNQIRRIIGKRKSRN